VSTVVEVFEHRDLSGSVFRDVNLRGAAFDDVNLSEVTIRGAYLAGLSIDQSDIAGMTVSGVRIDLLVEAELDRRDPWRARLRIADPYNPERLRDVLRSLGELREEFAHLLRSLSLDTLTTRSAPGSWSALECLRHMVFVEELYTNRYLLRSDAPWYRAGLVADFLTGDPEYADVGSEPTDDLEAVLAAWSAIHARTVAFVSRATADDLRRETGSAGSQQGTAGRDLQVLVGHTHAHIRQAEAAIREREELANVRSRGE
jgi:uncharacterized damage-inducible protein DinB